MRKISDVIIEADLTVDTNVLHVDSTNDRVGIGTTSPANMFHILGSVTRPLTIYNSVNAGGAGIEFSDHSSGSYTQKVYITAYHADSSSQGSGASIHFGSTESDFSVVSDKYIANGSSTGEASYAFYNDTNTGMYSPASDQIGLVVGNSRKLHLTTASGVLVQNGDFSVDTNVLYVDSTNDRVGVGTNSPSTLFHLAGSAAVATIQDNNSTGNTASAKILFTDNGTFGTIGTVGFDGNDVLQITNSHTGKILLSNTVGVNTSSPAHTLDVNGGAAADYFQLDTAATPTPAQGMFYWDPDEETAGLQVNGLNYELGQGLYWVAKNQTGSQIDKGTPVYASGTLGSSTRLLISPMIADGTIEAKYFLGLAAEDIADGTDGKVITQGKVRQLDTSGYGAAGNVLWVSASTAGQLTHTKPTGTGDIALAVAFVVDYASNGSIAARVSNLDENIVGVISTLDQVTTAGNTTTNDIDVGKVTVNQTVDNDGIRVYGYDDKSASLAKLYVDSAGNTKLTASNPSSSTYLQFTSDNYIQFTASSFIYTTSKFRFYDAAQLDFGSGGDYKIKYDSVNDILNIHTDTNEGITIGSTGNVLIGTTTDSGYKLDVNGTARFTNNVTISSSGAPKDLTIYGNSAGEFMQYDGSASALNIYGKSNSPALGVFVNGGAQPTDIQFKVGRDTGQYYGVKVDDGIAQLVHRQDETDTSIHSVYNEIWSSATGDHTWRWRVADNAGASGSEKMKLTKGSVLTLGGGSNTITDTKVGQWDTAYSWGDHSTQSYATQTYVNTQISNLVDSAPSTLDTLNELAAALGDDPNFATTVTNSIAGKVAKSGDTMTGQLTLPNAVFTGTSESATVLRLDGGSTSYEYHLGRAGTTRTWSGKEAFIMHTDSAKSIAFFSSGWVKLLEVEGTSGNTRIAGTLTVGGGITASGYNNSNWDTAYGWGDHGTAGYALSTDLANYMPTSGGTFSGAVVINGSLTVNGTITESSSIKIKENIVEIGGNLKKVNKLKPVSYNKIGSEKTELGLIAEEVQDVYPEFVKYDEDGEPVGISYSRLTVALIGAVKELTKELEELKNKING